MNNVGLVNRVNDAVRQVGAKQIVDDLMTFCSSDQIKEFLEFVEEEHDIKTSSEER